MHIHVVELPRPKRPLFVGTLAACLAFVRGEGRPGMTRLGIVVSANPHGEEPDTLACVPLAAFDAWIGRAAAVVDAWERRWLLIESMPSRHRDEARDELHQAVGAALVAAAMGGIDAGGAPGDDLPF